MSEPGVAPFVFWVVAITFGAVGPVLALGPLGMAPLVVAAAILATVAERWGGRWPIPQARAAASPALLLVWCVLSLAWTIDPAEGARKLLDLIAIFAATLILTQLTNRLGPGQRRCVGWALVGGVVSGLVLLGVETIFDFPLHRLVNGDDPKFFELVASKRTVDALPVLIWPAALALASLRRPWLGLGLAVVFTAACFKLTASSAKIAMVASLAVFALAALSVKAARRTLAAGVCVALALIIPFAIAAYDRGGTSALRLQRSAQHRIEIWHFAAERILERPLFGHGFDSSRVIPNGNEVSTFLGPGKPIIPLHPHDLFLQIWLELGLVGIGLALALLLAILNAASRLPPGRARFALAGYAAALIIAGLSFGIWQSWWLATLGFGVVACANFSTRGDNG